MQLRISVTRKEDRLYRTPTDLLRVADGLRADPVRAADERGAEVGEGEQRHRLGAAGLDLEAPTGAASARCEGLAEANRHLSEHD